MYLFAMRTVCLHDRISKHFKTLMINVNFCRKVIARDRAGHHQDSHAISDAWQRLPSGNSCRSVYIPRDTPTTLMFTGRYRYTNITHSQRNPHGHTYL
jgi:hypothetical protein